MTIYNQAERLEMERFSDTPIFNTKSVVQQTGVPAPTLRAWERRYALIAPRRAENTYRLYSERDIALVRWLKDRVDLGMSISQAVELFRHLDKERRVSTNLVSSSPPLQEDDSGIYDMQSARKYLLKAFQNLDEKSAHDTMDVMLSLYSLEQVCLKLIVPTLWELGRLWARDEMNVAMEHFASNFFRAFLTNIFHVTPNNLEGPLALTCCAPGEAHELAALMLSLFLRRRGMHVIYLGQSVETESMVHTAKTLAPALICVSITMSAYLPALADLGRQIAALPSPRPLFVFGGQALDRSPLESNLVPGIHLADEDLSAVTQRLLALLQDSAAGKIH